MTVTMDSTLGSLLDDPKAKTVLESYLPGISNNPLALMAKGMSLKRILAMPQASQLGLTQAKAEEILAEINKKI